MLIFLVLLRTQKNYESMIFVRDKGQMCNNIIQFIHAYAWARHNGLCAVSMRFAYKYRFFHICHTAWHNPLTYTVVKFLMLLHLLPKIEYKSLFTDYTDEERKVLQRKRPTVICGWLVRHYDLVERYLDEVKHLFSLTPSRQQRVDKLFAAAVPNGNRTIGLHIRRGDYDTFLNGRYNLSDSMYVDAVKRTLALYPDDEWTVVICTNDSELNEEYYRQELENITVYRSTGNAWEDLGLLAKCDYLLGVPSSYTMVATLYGHARLHWLTKEDKNPLQEDSFNDFMTSLRTFDNYFMSEPQPPRRVLFVISRFLDGGIDTVLLQYLNILAGDAHYDVTLAIGCNMGELEVFRNRIPKNVYVEYLVENRILCSFRIDRFRHNVSSLYKLFGELIFTPTERWIKRRQLNKLVNCNDVVIDFDSCHTAFLRNCPRKTVAWIHFSIAGLYKQNTRRTRRILRRLKQYTHIVAICDTMVNELKEMSPELTDHVVRIYNPIDVDMIREMAAEPLNVEYPYILAVERLEENLKDIKTLLHAYAKCDIPQHLVIVGKGNDEAQLRIQVEELGITKRVHFMGFQSNPYKWMAHADILVHSAKFEGFGIVLAEAMSIGCIVVSTDCPIGPKEVLDYGRAGILTPVGNANALADAIVKALSDKKLIEKIRDYAARHVIAFSKEVVSKELAEILK